MLFLEDIADQVGRETVGVVELESDITRQHTLPFGFKFLKIIGKNFQPMIQGFGKAFLLIIDHLVNERLGGAQVGINVAHEIDDLMAHRGQEGLFKSQEAAEPDGPAQDAAQDIAPAFVAGQDAVSD